MPLSGNRPADDGRQAAEITQESPPPLPPPAPAPAGLPPHPLLDNVVRQTMAAIDDRGAISPELMQKMADVARKYRGSEFVLDPAAVELIDVILGASFSNAAIAPEERKNIAREIARTLFEDPQVHARLAAFWQRLQEVQQ